MPDIARDSDEVEIAQPPRFEIGERVVSRSVVRNDGTWNGKEVGAVYMPAPQTGSPMTYMLNGKQYLVVAISGGNYPGELLAFRVVE